MRFLLHPTAHRATSQGIRKGKTAKRSLNKELISVQPKTLVSKTVNAPAQNNINSSFNSATTTSNNNTYVKSWGQQCSSSCGCVVRFEATINTETNKFTSASYHAKAVMVSESRSNKESGESRLEPAMTLRTNRPMFKSCGCDSLHALASQVTEYLPNKNALAIGSSMEFDGVRSSPAFRHTVLEKQGLSTANTHCFDVVEEALTAMVKGHMPKARPQVTLKEAYASTMVSDDNPFENPFGHYEKTNDRREGGSLTLGREDDFGTGMSTFLQPPRDSSTFLQPPRDMPALTLFDILNNPPYYSPFGGDDNEDTPTSSSDYEMSRDAAEREAALVTAKQLDWVTYVDSYYSAFGSSNNKDLSSSLDYGTIREAAEKEADLATAKQQLDWVTYVDELNGQFSNVQETASLVTYVDELNEQFSGVRKSAA